MSSEELDNELWYDAMPMCSVADLLHARDTEDHESGQADDGQEFEGDPEVDLYRARHRRKCFSRKEDTAADLECVDADTEEGASDRCDREPEQGSEKEPQITHTASKEEV